MNLPSRLSQSRFSDRQFAILLTLMFLAFGLFNTWHHVMWRDEVRTWQICRISPTLKALHENMRYEGVPIVWYFMVWLLNAFSADPFAMQVMHILIATGTVAVFACFSPFQRITKTLFTFGYFPFFEYATLARNYALVFLLFLSATAIIAGKTPRVLWLTLVLVVISHVSIWGAAFAALLLLTAMVRWTLFIPKHRRAGIIRWIVASIVVFYAIGLCYAQIVPGPGESLIGGWKQYISTGNKILRTIGTVWKGFVPLPQIQRHFWNTNILDNQLGLQGFLGALVLLFAVFMLLRRPAALVLFILGAIGLLTFTHFQFTGATRHYGQLFMVFVAACWIAASCRRWNVRPGFIGAASLWLDQRRQQILTAIFAVHVVSGVGANAASAVLPFSASKAAADYIRANIDPTTPLVGYPDFCIAPVSAYLGRPFYFPEMLAVSTYNTQDDQVRITIDKDIALAEAAAISKRQNREVLLVVMALRSLDDRSPIVKVEITRNAPPESFALKILPRFTDSTVVDEVYSLYLIRPAGANDNP